MKPVLFALALPLALAGCGAAKDLQPATGEALPVAPYGAAARQTPKQLLMPSPQARPDRNTELLKDSHKREADPFDLPPQ
jgi:hypothetical protein